MNLSEAYRTLGVPPNADETICKDAYKKLARKLHPDKNAGADTTARFQQVSAAYERTRSGHNLGEEVPDTKPAGASTRTPRSQAYRSPFSFTSSNVNYGFHSAKPHPSTSRGGSTDDLRGDFGTGGTHAGEGYSERLMREEEERLERTEASRRFTRRTEDAQNNHRRQEWAEWAQQESNARAQNEKEQAEREEDEHEANERHLHLKKKQELRSRAFVAAREGQLEILKSLIRKGVNPAGYEHLDPAIHKSKRAMGETMVHIAAKRNDTTMAEFLLNGASTEQVDEVGRTPLHVAALNGAKDVVLLLIADYHCSVESRDRDGSTPLVLAAQRGHVETFDMLIEKGARISTRDNTARTIKQKVQQSFNSAIQTPHLRERLQLVLQRIESLETRQAQNRRRREQEEANRRAEEAERKREEAERDRDYWMRQAKRLEEKIRKQNEDAEYLEMLRKMEEESRPKGPLRSSSSKRRRRKSFITQPRMQNPSPSQTASGSQRVVSPSGIDEDDEDEVIDALITQLVGMGFDTNEAASAARACGGDMTKAVEQLLQHSASSSAPPQRSKPKRKKPATPSFSTPNIDAILNGSYQPYSRQGSMENLQS